MYCITSHLQTLVASSHNRFAQLTSVGWLSSMALLIWARPGISVGVSHASVVGPLAGWRVDSLGWLSMSDDWQASWNWGTSLGWQVTSQAPGGEFRLLQEVASRCYSLTNGGVALSKPLLVSTGCWTKQVTRPHSESASQGHGDGVSSPPFFNKMYFGHILSPPPTPLPSPHLHTHPASCSLPSLSKTAQKQNKNQNKQDKKKYQKPNTWNKIPPNKQTPQWVHVVLVNYWSPPFLQTAFHRMAQQIFARYLRQCLVYF